MNVSVLERALAASGARPVLVDARVMRRVIKAHRHLPGLGLQVPHAEGYFLRREELLPLVDARELGRPVAELPEDVILLARPDPDDRRSNDDLLVELWQNAFHASVEAEIARLAAGGALTPARVRERIHRVGQTEFDEIRLVLRQDGRMLGDGGDLATYAEFAALYLELSTFQPALVAEVFPALNDAQGLRASIEDGLDVPALLEATKPAGAVLPKAGSKVAPRVTSDPPEPEDRPREVAPAVGPELAVLRQFAVVSRARGNYARSALLRLRAGDLAEAEADARALAERLVSGLRPRVVEVRGEAVPDDLEGESKAWTATILAVARHANLRGDVFRRVSARLLFDLQRAGIAGANAVGRVDLIDWVLSLGRRPLARLLPATREIRVARELASACAKLPRVELDEAERERLRDLLLDARRRADESIRRELREPIEIALRQVGFDPANVPERVALAKIVDELLDQATTHGHLSLGQLRDAVSRNQLKVHDLAGPRELVLGDPLLSADQRLARVIDGVHRRGEIYLRLLQKVSSLLFGTGVGRFVTFFILLPVGGAYMVPFAFQLVVTEVAHITRIWSHHHHLHLVPEPRHILGASPGEIALMVATGALLFGAIHSGAVRSALLGVLHATAFVLRGIFIDVPRWVMARAVVRDVLRSRVVHAVTRFVLRPAVVALALLYFGIAAVFYATPSHLHHHLARFTDTMREVTFGALYVVSAVVLNTKAGRFAIELGEDAAARSVRHIEGYILPGLFRLVASLFRRIVDGVDRGLYTVDEWLRFREGQTKWAIAAKAVLGLFWFAFAYVLRIYLNLLLEPTVNPIKHVPTVTVAAKMMLPVDKDLAEALMSGLGPVVGHSLAGVLAGLTVVSLPGFFGFLVWELKENYKLYKSTRAPTLRPVAIGHHGETMGALMKPGFHSGTLPKLWQKLRRAARSGDASVEKHREAMREIEEAVERFVDRELSAILATSDRFKGSVRVSRVGLASNRVRVELLRSTGREIVRSPHRAAPDAVHAESDARACAVAFEEQSGRIVACVADAAWVKDLTGDERIVFENALGGLYHRAGVDLVREQIAAALPAGSTYDVADEGLVVWTDGFDAERIYDLDAKGRLEARIRGESGGIATGSPVIERAEIVFSDHAIAWGDWVDAWTKEPKRLVKGASLLP